MYRRSFDIVLIDTLQCLRVSVRYAELLNSYEDTITNASLSGQVHRPSMVLTT